MSFQNLKVDELKEVAEFFVVDVEVADADHGPTKKELLAALAGGDDPVTWDQYKDFFLKAKESEAQESPLASEERNAPVVEHVEDAEEVDTSNHVLVKFDGKNPHIEVVGYTFSDQHPFQSVPPEVAEYLVRQQPGFRLAMPTEVTDYYS